MAAKVRLMTDKHKEVLRRYRVDLIKNVEAKYIVDHLVCERVITIEMMENVMSHTERRQQVSALLDLLERRDDRAFEVFLHSLKESYNFLFEPLQSASVVENYYYAGNDVLAMVNETTNQHQKQEDRSDQAPAWSGGGAGGSGGGGNGTITEDLNSTYAAVVLADVQVKRLSSDDPVVDEELGDPQVEKLSDLGGEKLADSGVDKLSDVQEREFADSHGEEQLDVQVEKADIEEENMSYLQADSLTGSKVEKLLDLLVEKVTGSEREKLSDLQVEKLTGSEREELLDLQVDRLTSSNVEKLLDLVEEKFTGSEREKPSDLQVENLTDSHAKEQLEIQVETTYIQEEKLADKQEEKLTDIRGEKLTAIRVEELLGSYQVESTDDMDQPDGSSCHGDGRRCESPTELTRQDENETQGPSITNGEASNTDNAPSSVNDEENLISDSWPTGIFDLNSPGSKLWSTFRRFGKMLPFMDMSYDMPEIGSADLQHDALNNTMGSNEEPDPTVSYGLPGKIEEPNPNLSKELHRTSGELQERIEEPAPIFTQESQERTEDPDPIFSQKSQERIEDPAPFISQESQGRIEEQALLFSQESQERINELALIFSQESQERIEDPAPFISPESQERIEDPDPFISQESQGRIEEQALLFSQESQERISELALIVSQESQEKIEDPASIFSQESQERNYEMDTVSGEPQEEETMVKRVYSEESIGDDKASSVCSVPKDSKASTAGDPNLVLLKKGDIVIVESAEGEETGEGPPYVHACDVYGRELLVPRTHLKRYGDPTGELWFYPRIISPFLASLILRNQPLGSYILYRARDKVGKDSTHYALSLIADQAGTVKHYYVQEFKSKQFGLNDGRKFHTLSDLQGYYQKDRGFLPCRLRQSPTPDTAKPSLAERVDREHLIEASLLDVETFTEVGRGAFGQVHVGEFQGRRVAVKSLRSTDEKAADFIENFFVEAQLMLRHSHTHLIDCLGVCIDANASMHIVLEMAEKHDLRQCLKSGEIDSEDTRLLLRLFKELLTALSFLDTHRIIHRDVAARNILLDANFSVKLGDFGMARQVLDDTYHAETHEAVAIAWASPEVLGELLYSRHSDVWAAGVTCWEMFSGGCRPYSGMRSAKVTKHVLGGHLLEKPEGCPQRIYNLMQKCWVKDRKARPTAAALITKLKAVEQGISTGADTRPPRRQVTEPEDPKTELEDIYDVNPPANMIDSDIGSAYGVPKASSTCNDILRKNLKGTHRPKQHKKTRSRKDSESDADDIYEVVPPANMIDSDIGSEYAVPKASGTCDDRSTKNLKGTHRPKQRKKTLDRKDSESDGDDIYEVIPCANMIDSDNGSEYAVSKPSGTHDDRPPRKILKARRRADLYKKFRSTEDSIAEEEDDIYEHLDPDNLFEDDSPAEYSAPEEFCGDHTNPLNSSHRPQQKSKEGTPGGPVSAMTPRSPPSLPQPYSKECTSGGPVPVMRSRRPPRHRGRGPPPSIEEVPLRKPRCHTPDTYVPQVYGEDISPAESLPDAPPVPPTGGSPGDPADTYVPEIYGEDISPDPVYVPQVYGEDISLDGSLPNSIPDDIPADLIRNFSRLELQWNLLAFRDSSHSTRKEQPNGLDRPPTPRHRPGSRKQKKTHDSCRIELDKQSSALPAPHLVLPEEARIRAFIHCTRRM